jgi:hypothetical protein
MIDLQQFCSKDQGRYYINKPWSRGDFTWATNGKILVRVPRRDDVPEQPAAPDAARIFTPEFEEMAFSPLPAVDWPKDPPPLECEVCDSRGTLHDCPDCHCVCPNCDGSGNHPVEVSVDVRGGIFSVKYMRMILSLPNVEFVQVASSGEKPTPFRFEGGFGLFAARRAAAKHHLGDIESLRAR